MSYEVVNTTSEPLIKCGLMYAVVTVRGGVAVAYAFDEPTAWKIAAKLSQPSEQSEGT